MRGTCEVHAWYMGPRSHPKANSECRMQNAEDGDKAAQSHIRACCGSGDSMVIRRQSVVLTLWLGRILAPPPERRIYAAVGRKTRPLPHKCGVPAHSSPELGGSARMCPVAPGRRHSPARTARQPQG